MLVIRPIHLFSALLSLAISCAGPSAEAPAALSSPPAATSSSRGIDAYVAHLRAHGEDPKEYVLGLFAHHDVVILGERLHPETTQWDFIYDVVTDPRFRDQVGTIYTEYGAVNLQDRLDRYLGDPHADREQLFGILRDFGNWPTGWGNANFADFLDRLRQFNVQQAAGKQIKLEFSDCFWDWHALDEHNFAAFARENLFARDFLMAKRIEMGIAVDQPRGRKKALVIMNTRHSYVIDRADDDNTGSYLRQLLAPHKLSVVSVMFNTTTHAPGANDRDFTPTLIAGGKWDAAFRAQGDRPVGFDLAGSPFGDDAFDLHERYRDLHYRDVYQGVVFINPIEKHAKQEVARGYMTPEFAAEVRRRLTYAAIGRTDSEIADNRRRTERFLELLTMSPMPAGFEDEIFGARAVYRGTQLEELERQIGSWLTAR